MSRLPKHLYTCADCEYHECTMPCITQVKVCNGKCLNTGKRINCHKTNCDEMVKINWGEEE